MPDLTLKLLGPPLLEWDGLPIEMGRRKAVALLAYLATTGQPHSRDSLAALFWPEYNHSAARTDLRRTLSVLNKTLRPGLLVTDRRTISLAGGADTTSDSAQSLWLDVAEFRHILGESQSHDHAADQICNECLSLLDAAVSLYRDDFLAGFTLRDSPEFDEWQYFEGESLRQELASALERLVHATSARGNFDQAISYARRWLALDPLHEPVHRHLMQLFAWSNWSAAAHRQYEQCRQILHEELGIPPSPETTKLDAAIRAGHIHDKMIGSPSHPVIPSSGHVLDRYAILNRLDPLPDQKLFGVETALAKVESTINAQDHSWLIAIDGLGGIGKTSLANALIHRMLEKSKVAGLQSGRAAEWQGVQYQDIGWVSAKQDEYLPDRGVQGTGKPALDAETLMDLLLAQLADGPYPTGSSQEKRMALLQLLQEKVSLVVVDNLETAIDYEAILPLLRHLANPSKFLITSRLSLASQGDIYCYSLQELDAKDALAFLRYEAKSRGMEALGRATDEQLHAIYATVGGNPLALKLVLGQIQFLPLAQVLATIRNATTERVEQLYSYLYWRTWQMLGPPSRHLLLTMPVVPNATFTQLGTASGLAIDALQTALMQLRALSLVELGGDLNEPRYRLHRLTETFLLHEVVKWQERAQLENSTDAQYFLQRVLVMVERWESDGAVQEIEIETLDQEHGSILKAISFGLELERAWPVVQRLIVALTPYMERRGHWSVWHTIAERAIGVAQQAEDVESEITLTVLLARLCQRQSRPQEVVRHYRRVIRLARRTGNRFEEARACCNLGYAYIDGGHWWRSEVLSCHALAVFEELGSQHGLAHTHNHLGVLYTRQEQWHVAENHLTTACNIWEASQNNHSLIDGYMNLGHLYVDMEKPESALRYLHSASRIAQTTGEVSSVAKVWNNMAIAYRLNMNWSKASHYAEKAESLFRKYGDLTGLANVWHNLGLIVYGNGKDVEARRYLEESLNTYQRLNNQPRIMCVREDLEKITASSVV